MTEERVTISLTKSQVYLIGLALWACASIYDKDTEESTEALTKLMPLHGQALDLGEKLTAIAEERGWVAPE